MIINPWRFQNGKDGPCNTDSMQKAFWTDVLKSLTLSHELLFEQARDNNRKMKEMMEKYPSFPSDLFLPNLEERIAEMKAVGV